MEILSFDDGGCIIEWNIENALCLEPWSCTSSPVFNIDALHKICGFLEVIKLHGIGLTFYFKLCHPNPSNVTINFTCFSKPNFTRKTGLLTFVNSTKECLFNYMMKDGGTKYLKIYFQLRVVGDNSLITNQYRLRSIVEAEQLKFKYTIPNISTWNTNEKIFIPFPSASDKPERFEITLCSEKADTDCVYAEIYRNTDSIKNQLLRCKLSIFDGESKLVLKSISNHEFLVKSEKFKFPNPISIKKLKQTSVNDVLTLDFKLLISEHKTNTWMEEYTTITNHQVKMARETLEKENSNLKDDLMCLYIERKFPDIEICADGKKFPAHKAILSARSPVFMAMFENNMQEKENNLVEISDIDSETVDRMLFFIYSEVLQDQRWDSVTKLYVASDKYQIMTLKDKCSLILKEQLSLNNVSEALCLADMHCDLGFLNAVQDFIIFNDEKVLESEEWKDLMNIHPKIACQAMHKVWTHRSKNI